MDKRPSSSTVITILLSRNSGVAFQVLKAARMKNDVLWDVTPRSFVETDQCCRGVQCLSHHHPDAGGSKHLGKTSQFITNHMAQHPRRQASFSLGCGNSIVTINWLWNLRTIIAQTIVVVVIIILELLRRGLSVVAVLHTAKWPKLCLRTNERRELF